MAKKFYLNQSDMKQIIEANSGSCFASDRIMVDGEKVGVMSRDAPTFEGDSGWSFFCGDESDEYLEDTNNVGIYSLNTLCNYDKDIVPYLGEPEGASYFRNDDGSFELTELDDEDGDSEDNPNTNVAYLTDTEMNNIEKHFEKYIGKIDGVFHEIISNLVHVDLLISNPTKERPYYTLMTMGMSAREMYIPEELRCYGIARSELLICLPKDWNISESTGGDSMAQGFAQGEKDYWPVRWLKILSRLPFDYKTWLGFGHTIPNGDPAEPFAENTGFTCVILNHPHMFHEDFSSTKLNDSADVTFYYMTPIYNEEMQLKLGNDAETLFEKLDEMDFVLNLSRKNVCQ